VQFLGGRDAEGGASGGGGAAAQQFVPASATAETADFGQSGADDDIPF
jgi:hypothetical protein